MRIGRREIIKTQDGIHRIRRTFVSLLAFVAGQPFEKGFGALLRTYFPGSHDLNASSGKYIFVPVPHSFSNSLLLFLSQQRYIFIIGFPLGLQALRYLLYFLTHGRERIAFLSGL